MEHEDHPKMVLKRLRTFALYCKADKSQFGASEIGFLGYIISSVGISMASDRISTIQDWPTSTSIRDVQVLLHLTNIYRRFIRIYAKVTAPIFDLLMNLTSK